MKNLQDIAVIIVSAFIFLLLMYSFVGWIWAVDYFDNISVMATLVLLNIFTLLGGFSWVRLLERLPVQTN